MKKFIFTILTLLALAGFVISQDAVIQCHPNRPTNFHGGSNCEMVGLAWSHDGSGYLRGFELERKKHGTGWIEIARLDSAARSYTDRNVEEGDVWSYRLRALGRHGSSQWVYTTITVPKCDTPEPKPKRDCEVNLDYFYGSIMDYYSEEKGKYMYYVSIRWGVDRVNRSGTWTLYKVRYGKDKMTREIKEAFYKRLFVIDRQEPGSGETDFVYEDYNVSRNQHVMYLLVWECEKCKPGEKYGIVHLYIPRT